MDLGIILMKLLPLEISTHWGTPTKMLQDHQWFGKQAGDLYFLAFLYHILWLSHSLGSWFDWGCKSNFLGMSKIHWQFDISKYVKEPFNFQQSTACEHLLDQKINPRQSSNITNFPHLQHWITGFDYSSFQLLSLSQELVESCNEQGTPLGLVIDLVAQLRWPRCGIFDDYIGLYEENWFERWIKFR